MSGIKRKRTPEAQPPQALVIVAIDRQRYALISDDALQREIVEHLRAALQKLEENE